MLAVAAVEVALWVARIPLSEDYLAVPVVAESVVWSYSLTSLVVAEPVAVLTGQTEKAVGVGCAVVCIPSSQCLAAICLPLLSSRPC